MVTNQEPFTHPTKWRETADPFLLHFHSFQVSEILGYPHAGNDVFHVKGFYNGSNITAYIKVARQSGAAIEHEVDILRQLTFPHIPQVIDSDFNTVPFSVTTELPGLRLSTIVGDNQDMLSLEYMSEYGEMLSLIHQLTIPAESVADRRFFHVPTDDILNDLGLFYLKDYFSKKPSEITTVFCHGDFHYANILWNQHHISGILDFELSGYGNRDYDIAWALFLRPGQKFLTTEIEQIRFLEGYAKHGQYNWDNVIFYMAQIYTYFLRFSGDDIEYCNYVKTWLNKNCVKPKL